MEFPRAFVFGLGISKRDLTPGISRCLGFVSPGISRGLSKKMKNFWGVKKSIAILNPPTPVWIFSGILRIACHVYFFFHDIQLEAPMKFCSSAGALGL